MDKVNYNNIDIESYSIGFRNGMKFVLGDLKHVTDTIDDLKERIQNTMHMINLLEGENGESQEREDR